MVHAFRGPTGSCEPSHSRCSRVLQSEENSVGVVAVTVGRRRPPAAEGVLVFLNLIWDFDGTLFDTYPAIANSLRAAVGELTTPPSFEAVRDMALISNSLPRSMR